MNPLSDSLMTPLSGAATRGTSPLGAGDAVNADGPGAGEQGAPGGFAAVLGRVQEGRVAGDAGTETPAEPLAQPGLGANGDALTQVVEADALVQQDGGMRQGMAAAFAAQWAALLPAGEGQSGAADDGELGLRATEAVAGAPNKDAIKGLGALGLKGLAWNAGLAGLGGAGFGSPGAGAAGADGEPAKAEAQAETAPVAAAQVADDSLAAAAAGLPFMPVPSVVALQISPQLSVITAGQPTSSDESLRAYAAAQGFDAAALQRMFGAGAAPAALQQTGSAATGFMTGSTAHLPAAPGGAAAAAAVAAGVAAPAARSGGPEPGSQAGLFQGLVAMTLSPQSRGQNTSSASNASSSSLNGSDVLAMALERFSADGGRLSAGRSDPTATAGTGDMARQAAGAALAQGASAGPAGLGGAGGLGGSGGTGLSGLSGLSGAATTNATTATAAMSAWWALQARDGFLSTAGVTAGAGPAAITGPASGAVDAVDAAPAWAGGDSAAPSTAAVANAGDQAAPVHKAQATAQATAQARPVDTQPIDLRDHLEQSHEALSKRLGEALAARMLAQIEKGDWQIRLSVAPAHLGPIDIDLQMRGQRMEAQFQVAHGQTQALIQDSLPRLREAVGASGMDLASVWVSGGWNERNRGNPTPGQPNDPALSALKEGGGDEPEVSGAPSVDSRGPGWVPRTGGVDILI